MRDPVQEHYGMTEEKLQTGVMNRSIFLWKGTDSIFSIRFTQVFQAIHESFRRLFSSTLHLYFEEEQ